MFTSANSAWDISCKQASLFSFGVASDIQYADKDEAIGRHYRDSIEKLHKCVEFWNSERLDFVIQLGDLVDTGGIKTLSKMFSIYNLAKPRKYSVLGNHDFVASRKLVMEQLNMPASFYDYSVRGWRFVVLDGMNVSVKGGWEENDHHAIQGRTILSELIKEKAPNAKDWNGAIGVKQRAWLRRILSEASFRNERVIVFCHFPVLPASCRPETLLWDYVEALKGNKYFG